MRGALVVVIVLAGCGFSTGGQSGPGDASGGEGPRDSPAVSDGSVDQMPDASPAPSCPSMYEAIGALTGSSRYRFVASSEKWIDAETDCENDSPAASSGVKTHLIVLDDQLERTAMIGGILGGGNLNDQWVGATDLAQEGTSLYVTEQAQVLALSPSMQADNKDCIRMKNSGNAEYRDCDETNKYVCECDRTAADPTRYPNLPDGNN